MKTEDQINQILAEVVEMLQGVGAATGMSALLGLIESLLIAHKQMVAALPGEYREELKQELLNIVMIHVLSPCGDAQKALAYMGAFAVTHKEPCSAEVEMKEKASVSAEGSGVTREGGEA